MRPTLFFLVHRYCIAVLVAVWPFLTLPGQTTLHLRVSARYETIPLREALQELEMNHQLRFSYLDATVNGLMVNCTFEQAGWEEVRDCLFARHGIEAEVLSNGQITLRAGAARDWEICLITKSEAGETLPFVTVGNAGKNVQLITGDDGRLQTTIRLRPADSLDLSYLGYATRKVAPADALNCPVITLAPASVELAAVTVTEYLASGISATADGRRVILNPSALNPAPGFADREIFRDLARLPGVSSIRESAGNLSIRGGTPDQHLVLWDNIPVYSSGHYLGMISNFSPDLVQAVDVWRGRSEAEFGGHVSGVVRMTTDRSISDRFNAGVQLSLLQLQSHARLPIARDKSDVQLAFRGNIPALLTGPGYDSYRNQALQGYRVGETEGTVEDFRFGEFNGRWQYNPAPAHAFTLSGFRQIDDLSYGLMAGNRRFRDELRTVNTGGSLQYVFAPNQSSRTEAWLTLTDFSGTGENAFSSRATDIASTRASGIRERSLKVMHTRQTVPGQRWQAGLQGQFFEHGLTLESANLRAGASRFVNLVSGKATVLAPYGSFGWETGPLQVQLGLRTPWYAPTGRVYVEPRLSGSYRLGEAWRLKAGLGYNHQFPLQILDFDQNRVSQAAPLWTLANGNVFPVAAGREISAGWSGSPGPWLFDVELYYKQVNGLSATALSLNTENTAGFANGNSLARGVDVLVRRRYGPWRSGLVYSLSRTTWSFPGLQNEDFPANFDRTHQLELEQSFRSGSWQVSAAWLWQTGAPFTAGTAGPVELVGGQLAADIEYGPLNAARLPDYQRLDLAVSYAWRAGEGKRWSGDVTLSLLNILGQDNVLERNYVLGVRDDPPPGERRIIAEEVDRIGLGRTLGLSVGVDF